MKRYSVAGLVVHLLRDVLVDRLDRDARGIADLERSDLFVADKLFDLRGADAQQCGGLINANCAWCTAVDGALLGKAFLDCGARSFAHLRRSLVVEATLSFSRGGLTGARAT